MRFTSMATLALGLAAKLAATHPAAADSKDPTPIGDLLWECKAVSIALTTM